MTAYLQLDEFTVIETVRKYLSTAASNYFPTGTFIRPRAGLTANNVVANLIIGVKVDQTVARFFSSQASEVYMRDVEKSSDILSLARMVFLSQNSPLLS